MARGLQEIQINFPPSLMNTAVSANLQPNKFGRYIKNMLPAEQAAGAGQKRAGFFRKWDEVTQGDVREVIEFRKSDGTLEVLLYTDESTKFTIRKVNADGSNTLVLDNLSSNGLLRHETFNQKLVICNGIDNNKAYDGTSWVDLEDTVKEDAVTTWISSTQIKVNTGDDQTGRYTSGAWIEVTWNGGKVTTTVSSSSYNAGTGETTITIASGSITNSTPHEVWYKDKPPAFSDLMKNGGYLYALSGGQTKAADYRGSSGLTIYQTDRPNNEHAWFNADTQAVPFLNCADHHIGADEFLRLSKLGGYIIAHGRNALQIWNITDVTTSGGAVFQKTIPVGLANGNLLQQFPSDVLIFTQYGARSLQTVFKTEGLEVTSDLGTNIDPTITSEVKKMMVSDTLFKNALSFLYEGGGFYGFRLNNDVLVYSLSEESKGWVIFNGLFEDCTAVRGLSDGRLILFKGGKGYVYGNGRDTELTTNVTGGDDGEPIETIWWSKWFRMKKRWATRYWELMLESSDAMSVEITRMKNTDENSVKTLTLSVDANSALWGEALWGTDTWIKGDKEPRVRDKFTCDSFAFVVRTNNTEADFTILGIKAIGD